MEPKLLIIDEKSSYLSFIERILINEGFDVLVAGSDAKINNYFKSNLPDIVLIDVLMNKKHGFRIMKTIKKEYHYSNPLIVISAAKDIKTIKKAFSYGAYDYLIKPLNFKDLLNKINNALKTNSQVKNKYHV